MNSKVKEALKVLGFRNIEVLPKLKEIRKSFLKLSLLYHPDRNNSSEEANAKFQVILEAYEVAGKAVEETTHEGDDSDEELARKIFKQFSFASVKENICSFTIITEKSLYSS